MTHTAALGQHGKLLEESTKHTYWRIVIHVRVKPNSYLHLLFRIYQGHSAEQFRIYEAIEAGAIPVLELNNGTLRRSMPPSYFDSGMLFVQKSVAQICIPSQAALCVLARPHDPTTTRRGIPYFYWLAEQQADIRCVESQPHYLHTCRCVEPVATTPRWDDAPQLMMDLVKSADAITSRQQRLRQWYSKLMQDTLIEIEEVLEQQKDPSAGSTCK